MLAARIGAQNWSCQASCKKDDVVLAEFPFPCPSLWASRPHRCEEEVLSYSGCQYANPLTSALPRHVSLTPPLPNSWTSAASYSKGRSVCATDPTNAQALGLVCSQATEGGGVCATHPPIAQTSDDITQREQALVDGAALGLPQLVVPIILGCQSAAFTTSQVHKIKRRHLAQCASQSHLLASSLSTGLPACDDGNFSA